MLAVVLFHVVAWHLVQLDVAPAAARLWDPVTAYLGSVRMPLLLAVSGLLASDRVRAGLRSGGLLRRASASGYLFVVWTAVYAIVYAVLADPDLPHAPRGPAEALLGLVLPQTPLWYIFALAVYVLLLGALHRLPPVLVVAALGVLSVVVDVVDPDVGTAAKIPELAVYFALGVYGKDVLLRWADPVRVRPLVLAGAAALGTLLLGRFAVDELSGSVIGIVRGAAFLVLGVLAIRWVTRVDLLRRPLEWTGQRTLPVYVLHVPLLLVLLAVVDRTGWSIPDELAARAPSALAYPLLLTAVLVGTSLALHRLAHAAGGRALFAAPSRLMAVLPAPTARPAQRPGHRPDTDDATTPTA